MKKLLIVILLLVGLGFRLSGLMFGLPSKNLAVTTYNPDEPLTFEPMQEWSIKKLDFHPRRAFLWGGFHLYVVAPVLKISELLGIVKIGGRDFIQAHLKEADKLYIIGRFIMIIFGVLSILLLYLICKNAYNETTGIFASLMLAILPAHIVNSFYLRPDVMTVFLGLAATLFAVKIIETGEFKYYFLSSFIVGLSGAAKLSGGVYAVMPVIAHFLRNTSFRNKLTDYKVYLVPVICLLGFIAGTPYAILDFNRTNQSFYQSLKVNWQFFNSGTHHGEQNLMFGTGLKSYFTYYLKYAMGSMALLASVVSIFTIFSKIVLPGNLFKKYDIFFIISGIIVLIVISRHHNQTVWYTLPALPFLCLYMGRFFSIVLEQIAKKTHAIRILGVSMFCFVICYTFVYAIATANLFLKKNIREQASIWIEENIPKTAVIGIPRSYFWTPGILRQYNPPYKILYGGDPVKSSVQEAILGLPGILEHIDYLVISEFEYRAYIGLPLLEKNDSPETRILKGIMEREFVKVTEFDEEAKFLFFTFRRKYPPADWLIPNPKIIILKKKV